MPDWSGSKPAAGGDAGGGGRADQLRAALAYRKHEREEDGGQVEPGGDVDAGGEGASERAQGEAEGDREDIPKDEPFEAQGVGHVEREVGGDRGGEEQWRAAVGHERVAP